LLAKLVRRRNVQALLILGGYFLVGAFVHVNARHLLRWERISIEGALRWSFGPIVGRSVGQIFTAFVAKRQSRYLYRQAGQTTH